MEGASRGSKVSPYILISSSQLAQPTPTNYRYDDNVFGCYVEKYSDQLLEHE